MVCAGTNKRMLSILHLLRAVPYGNSPSCVAWLGKMSLDMDLSCWGNECIVTQFSVLPCVPLRGLCVT
jgi:hypothetical protein